MSHILYSLSNVVNIAREQKKEKKVFPFARLKCVMYVVYALEVSICDGDHICQSIVQVWKISVY